MQMEETHRPQEHEQRRATTGSRRDPRGSFEDCRCARRNRTFLPLRQQQAFQSDPRRNKKSRINTTSLAVLVLHYHAPEAAAQPPLCPRLSSRSAYQHVSIEWKERIACFLHTKFSLALLLTSMCGSTFLSFVQTNNGWSDPRRGVNDVLVSRHAQSSFYYLAAFI
jgi:hypothetical protein